jgi:hypothetical protein
MIKKDCAFQYAKMREGIFRDTKIIEDKSELTLDEAKELWKKHYPDAASWIKEGNSAEMVIWVNMVDSSDYRDTLEYISTDAESDGVNIWVTERIYFTKEIK